MALSVAMLVATAGEIVPATAAEIEVTITSFSFSPAQVTVRPGDTIRWVNKDSVRHTATALDKSFDVAIPANGQGVLVVKETGKLDYFCRFHAMMRGAIQVAQ